MDFLKYFNWQLDSAHFKLIQFNSILCKWTLVVHMHMPRFQGWVIKMHSCTSVNYKFMLCQCCWSICKIIIWSKYWMIIAKMSRTEQQYWNNGINSVNYFLTSENNIGARWFAVRDPIWLYQRYFKNLILQPGYSAAILELISRIFPAEIDGWSQLLWCKSVF